MYTNEQLNAIHFSKIGFEFEFFSNKDISETKDSLARSLDKRLRIEEKAHSDFTPTDKTFKLEPDNSGGSGMIELVTGPLPFVEAKIILAKTLKWIKENGSTNDKCSIHVNLAFDGKKLGPETNVSKLDIGKFVLSFNENRVYELFPDRKNSVYAKSIKFITPLSGFHQTSPEKTLSKNYMFVSEKYYGVNFGKVPKGYIEFRYIGGKDYEKKYSKILNLTEHFIISLYESLVNPKYTKDDIKQLDAILEQHKSVIRGMKSYSSFKEYFPNIKVMADLNSSENVIEMYFVKMRDKLFELITKAGLTEGWVNYDSDISRMQIKNAKLDKIFELTDVDIVDCELRGNVTQCDIFSSDVADSSLKDCNVFGASNITKSKIEDSYVNRNVIAEDCYVYGLRGVFSGEMEGGIFRKGRITNHARISNNTEVIEYEKIK
jgi:hypothetical protein